jgi:hypothetical protein
MMEAVSSSKTSVNIQHTTWGNIPEDSHLPTCRWQNLKYQPETFLPLPGFELLSASL